MTQVNTFYDCDSFDRTFRHLYYTTHHNSHTHCALTYSLKYSAHCGLLNVDFRLAMRETLKKAIY